MFTAHGDEVEVIGKANDGKPIIKYEEDGEWEIYSGILSESPPPVEEHPHVVQLRSRRDELNAENVQLQGQIQELKKTFAAQQEQMKEFEALLPAVARVLKFRNGGFTHAVVFHQYGKPRVVESKELCVDGEPLHRGMKLMSLFGLSNGDFEYRINTYKDGSGEWTGVELHESREAAIEALSDFCISWLAKFDTARLDCHSRLNGSTLAWIVDACSDYGIAIDPKYQAAIDASRLTNLERQAAKLRADLDKVSQDISSITPQPAEKA